MCTKKGKLWEIDADSDDTDADTDQELMRKWADEQMFRWANEQILPSFPNQTVFRSEFFPSRILSFFQTELDSVQNFFWA